MHAGAEELERAQGSTFQPHCRQHIESEVLQFPVLQVGAGLVYALPGT